MPPSFLDASPTAHPDDRRYSSSPLLLADAVPLLASISSRTTSDDEGSDEANDRPAEAITLPRVHRSLCCGSFSGDTVTLSVGFSAREPTAGEDTACDVPILCKPFAALTLIAHAGGGATGASRLPRDRWDADMELCRLGVRALLVNDFDESEAIFLRGMNLPPHNGRDLRSGFALCRALVSALKGVATFADEQLVECAERLRAADELASQGKAWTGSKVIRGICTLILGLVYVLQRKFVKGIYHVFKSWKWMKCLPTEALFYEGRERDLVRSAALYALGAFSIIVGLLPKDAARVATWVSGFSGSTKEGLEMMRTCRNEGGLLAPFAALAWIAVHVDTKTFLGETLTPGEEEELHETVRWADERYPGSIFFTGLASDCVAVTKRDIPKARRMQEQEADEMSKLPGLLWVLNYKRGIYYLTEFKWHAAGLAFRASMDVYIKAGRRSMVPFAAGYALLCMMQSLEEGIEVTESRAVLEEMTELLGKYKAMPKKDWGRQDKWAFHLYAQYLRSDEVKAELLPKKKKGKKKRDLVNKPVWPMLELLHVMVLQVRCLWWMALPDIETLHARIKKELEARDGMDDGVSAGDQIRIIMYQMEIYRHLAQHEKTFGLVQKADELEPCLTKTDIKFGAMAMIDYYAALIHRDLGDISGAKYHAHRLKCRGSDHYLHAVLLLKTVALEQNLGGLDYTEDFESVDIPAGKKLVLAIRVDQGTPSWGVKWFWRVKKYAVDFTATFQPDEAGTEPILLQKFERSDESDGQANGLGVFPTEAQGCGLGPGRIVLMWDNSFSVLRGKTVFYHVSPQGQQCEIFSQ